MPVTARLSKLLYERLGEQIANELVDWFNAVDATYRADLRELNELNFARFDAKLEQRVTQLEAKINQRIAELRGEFKERITEMGSQLASQMSQLETKLERRLGEQTKWLLAAWGVLLASVIGLWFRR
ncbi:MAG: hypothetical protein ACT4PM_06065 [Gemmatimonadales bacterium]